MKKQTQHPERAGAGRGVETNGQLGEDELVPAEQAALRAEGGSDGPSRGLGCGPGLRVQSTFITLSEPECRAGPSCGTFGESEGQESLPLPCRGPGRAGTCLREGQVQARQKLDTLFLHPFSQQSCDGSITTFIFQGGNWHSERLNLPNSKRPEQSSEIYLFLINKNAFYLPK